MAVGDIAQVAIRYRCYGQTMVNVQHFRANSAATGLDVLLATFRSGGTASVIERLADCLNTQTRITDLRAIYVRGGAPVEETEVVDRPGDITTTNPLPNTVSVLVSCRSAMIGRSNRGRLYLPPPTSSQLDGPTGLWTVGYRSTVQEFINQWQTAFTVPGEWTHVVWSPTLNTAFGTGYIPPVVADMLIDPVPRGQRRRAIELGAF